MDKHTGILSKPADISNLIANASLEKPFSSIFADPEEANWAFELMAETAKKLGVASGNDLRISISVRHYSRAIHFNFCSWLILGFYRLKNGKFMVRIPLIESLAKNEEVKSSFSFAKKENQPVINSYIYPGEQVKTITDDMQKALDETLVSIKSRFANHTKSPYQKTNIKQIALAVYDQGLRSQLFAEGLEPDIFKPDVW